MKKIISLVLILSLILVGCSTGDNTPAEGDNVEGPTVVRVGLTGSDSKVWNHVKEEAAKENIDIQLVFFDSYPLPNAALNSGEIDLNSFQHYIYLNTEVEQHGYELSVIGETSFAPLGLYSKQIQSVDELEDGAKIVIPDDVTNGGRALLLLQENGLITVDPAAGNTPTIKDIENPRNFEIIELAATNIPASLEEVPLAAINSGVARDAGFIPTQDAIVLEDSNPGENPYINIIVARTEDKDNEVYNRIVELYQTDATKAVIEEDSKGSSIPVW
ncbi:MetQ/NlpA family ABC transporter substrate-binding protein [Tissierella sp. Yu-01]|uniref:MetQ/NlpA family ABC transporter substrate-binding protein n=1 Tax=Tissierella sp. Yu-01 TaxID=3035694 RepID=UPI00240DF830|nr:MetQ/NlpA family ABC transporter substrate-binding protein [Tissierella sp. Yu-01]WFA09275.1 MetQ/NlpA family ABC transporter substrate-binding protein [Tissierella sp. Yu-01]